MVLQNENTELVKKEIILKEEIERIKIYHSSKQNEAIHQYKKLMRDYQHLKKICEKGNTLKGFWLFIKICFSQCVIKTKSFRKFISGSKDVLMQMLGKYRKNEEIYKNTIQKLQQNNQNLMEKILQLKEENISNWTT